MRSTLVSALAAMLLAGVPAAGGAGWTQWGGPGRDFRVAAGELAERWPADGPPRLWSRELGAGYSAVLYDGGVLYTMARTASGEAILALDAATGRTLWAHEYPARPYANQTTQFGGGPNATPLIVGNRLYAVGFTARMHCLDKRSGKLLWDHDLVRDFDGKKPDFGYASSPIEHDGMVIVLVGGPRHGAVGFDSADGSVRWKSEPVDFSYSSPLILEVGGRPQLVFMAPTEVVGLDLASGRRAWSHAHENQYQNNCAGPWWDSASGLLFVSSQGDAGGRTLRLEPGEEGTRVTQVFADPRMRVFHNTALRIGDYLYAGSHEVVVAHNVRTGETAWKHDGFAEANLLLAGDRVILLDEQGQLALAEMSPQGMRVLARHKLLEKPAWTVPTLVDTRLYVRGKSELLALDLSGKARGTD